MNRFFITVSALCLWCLLAFGCASSSQEDPAYSTYPAHRGQGPMNQETMNRGAMPHDRGYTPHEGLVSPYEEIPMPHDEGYRAPQRHLSLGDDAGYPEHMMDSVQGIEQTSGQSGGQSSEQAHRMREVEQERRFMQDQESRTRDFRRAFPHEPAPRQDAYRSYEGSRPPQPYDGSRPPRSY